MVGRRILGAALAAALGAVPAVLAQDYECGAPILGDPGQIQRPERSPVDIGLYDAGGVVDDGGVKFQTLVDIGDLESAQVVLRVGIIGNSPDAPPGTIFCFPTIDLANFQGQNTNGQLLTFRFVKSGDGFAIQPEGGEPLPEGSYIFGLEATLVEGGQLVRDAFDNNNFYFPTVPVFLGSDFQARFTGAELGDDGSLDVTFTAANFGTLPTGTISVAWVSGDDVIPPVPTDGLPPGTSREMSQTFENPGESVQLRVVRVDPEEILYDETTNLPVGAGGPDPDGSGNGNGNGNQDPPTDGVDFDITTVGLRSEGEGFYDIAVIVTNVGDTDAQTTPNIYLNAANLNVIGPDEAPVVVNGQGNPLRAGEESAEARFHLNLGTDPDARVDVVSGSITVTRNDEDQNPENNEEGFELQVPDDGSTSEEPTPPAVYLKKIEFRDEPPVSYGEPGTLRVDYTLANDGAAGTRLEVDFNAEGGDSSIVTQLEANGATIDQGNAEHEVTPIPAGPGVDVYSGSIRFVVPEEAWDQAYQGVLVVRQYYENADGEEVMVEPVSRFEIGFELPVYPKPDLKVQVVVNGARNPEALTPPVGSQVQVTIRALNVGRVPVDESIGVTLLGSLLGDQVVETTEEGGMPLDGFFESAGDPVTVDCDTVAKIQELGGQATVDGATWLAVEGAQDADSNADDNTRTVPVEAPANDCGDGGNGSGEDPCEDGDPTTLCDICNDGNLQTECPLEELNCDMDDPPEGCATTTDPTPCQDGNPDTPCASCNDGNPDTQCPEGEVDNDQPPSPCEDGDPATPCPVCDDGDPNSECPEGEIDFDNLPGGPENPCANLEPGEACM